MDWGTGLAGLVAGLLIAMMTAPGGVSGAVFLLPAKLRAVPETQQQVADDAWPSELSLLQQVAPVESSLRKVWLSASTV